jgi:hypothetical protein
MGIHIRAFKATTRGKDFTFGKPFVDYHKLYNIVLILCILLLCRFFNYFLLFLTFIHMKEQEKTMQIRVFKRGGQRSTLIVGCRKKNKMYHGYVISPCIGKRWKKDGMLFMLGKM